MAAIASTIKSTLTSTPSKQTNLATDTVDLPKPPINGLTTDAGLPVSDTDSWLKVTRGEHVGPSLLEDNIAREKIHRFDHERIPERVVHARGAAAHGYFRAFASSPASKYTSAGVLTDSSRTTPVFARFSTVQGSRGSADTVRDVRGFAVKFYTEEGNWDLVGNNIPVFFVQDAIKFPDFVHAVKPEPHNEVPTGQSAHNNFWDFFNLQPETSHMVMWAMSDRGIPRSYRMMQGFGVNTFTLTNSDSTNSDSERFFVKFHWLPELGVHSLVWDEALKICGQDPDFHRKDLEEAIQNGAPAKWTLAIQVIPDVDEHKYDFDILDATKIWPEELVPLIPIGEMVLDRVVDEYFTETEQVAFCTSHVVPGIGFSDDPLLQGRNFSYFDTQITRLGVNWQELPINRPLCPYMNFNRDGQLRHRITKGNVNYWPNRYSQLPPVPPSKGGYQEFPERVVGIKQRMRGVKFNEHHSQAQLFYNSLAAHEKRHLIAAISFELSHCDDPLVYENAIPRLMDIDSTLAQEIAMNVSGGKYTSPVALSGSTSGKKGLAVNHPNHGRVSKNLSQMDFMPSKPTIKSRRVAILIADGFDMAVVTAVKGFLLAAGAVPFVIGPRRNAIKSSTAGQTLMADHHFEGQRSTLFDALFIPSGADSAQTLLKNGRVVHWVREAFGHLKVIGAVGEGVLLVKKALETPSLALSETQAASTTGGSAAAGVQVTVAYGVVTAPKYDGPSSLKEGWELVKGATTFAEKFAYEMSLHRCWERESSGAADMVAF